MNSITFNRGLILWMDTIFMNYEISTTTDPNRKLLNLSDIKNLKMSGKYVIL